MRKEDNKGNKRLFTYLFNKFIKRKKILICIGTSLQNRYTNSQYNIIHKYILLYKITHRYSYVFMYLLFIIFT